MAKLTVKGFAKCSSDFFRGNVTGDIYLLASNGGYFNLTKGHVHFGVIGRVDLTPLDIGTIITIEVDK